MVKDLEVFLSSACFQSHKISSGLYFFFSFKWSKSNLIFCLSYTDEFMYKSHGQDSYNLHIHQNVEVIMETILDTMLVYT